MPAGGDYFCNVRGMQGVRRRDVHGLYRLVGEQFAHTPVTDRDVQPCRGGSGAFGGGGDYSGDLCSGGADRLGVHVPDAAGADKADPGDLRCSGNDSAPALCAIG